MSIRSLWFAGVLVAAAPAWAQTFAEIRIHRVEIDFSAADAPAFHEVDTREQVFRTERTRREDSLTVSPGIPTVTIPSSTFSTLTATYDYTLTVADAGRDIPLTDQRRHRRRRAPASSDSRHNRSVCDRCA